MAGLTGTYPSAGNRLVNNTATADLTSFGPGTTVGAYEFFDSTGSVYAATVADGGTVTPTTSNQTISAAGTLYRSVIVQGDANLTTANIKDTVPLFGVTGSLTGTPANCNTNGQQNCLATATFFGATQCSANSSNCYVPTYAVTTQPLKAISYDAIDAGKSSIRSSLTLSGISGTLADCAAGGTTGCVTTATYKSLDLSSAGAASSTGVTAANFNTKIATSGNFEFWDVSGARHQVAGDTDLTASNVKSSIDIFGAVGNVTPTPANCSTNGGQSCVATGSYYAATACATDGSNCFVPTYAATTQPLKAISYDAIDAGKSSIRSSLTLSGITGTLADCAAGGTTGCVTTATYKSLDLSNVGAASSTGVTAANFNTKIATLGNFEFWDASGARHQVAGDTDLTASNVKSAIDIFGTVGSVTPTPANCSSNGGQSCVATGSYYAATSCADDGSNCFVPTYAATTQPLKAISYDAIDSGKSSIRSSLTLSGIAGTLGDCTTNNTSGCVTTASYKSADWTNLTAANIKNGASVAGLTGTYPSASNRLVSNTATADLTAFGPATPVGAYEFFDSAGDVYPATVADGGTITPSTSTQSLNTAGTMYRAATINGDADLVAGNILSGTNLFGVNGSVTATPANCSSNGTQSCVATGSYFAATACAADGSNCFVPTYAVTTQPLKAISYDAIDAGKSSFRSSLTLSGISGTLADCAAGGTTGCVTTATYKSLDLSSAGAASSTGVTAANFNTKIATSGNFEFWDASGARHQVAGDTDLTASNVKSSIDIFGTVGNVTPTPANCGSNGAQSCVATGSYYAATACAADSSNCFVPTYVTTTQPLKAISYDAIDADKILSGNTIGSVPGNVTLPDVAKVLTATNFGVSGTGSTGTLTLPAAADVRTGSGAYGEPGSQLTPAYSPDFPAVGNVLSSDTVNSVSGTLTLPGVGDVEAGVIYGVGGNGSTGSFAVPTLAQVQNGVGYGAAGSEFTGSATLESHSSCSGGGQTGCLATATYPTMNLSVTGGTGLTSANFAAAVASASTYQFWDGGGARHTVTGDTDLSEGNLKTSVVIHGVTGAYPSASYLLPSASGTADLDSATFDAKIKSATAFEYWTSTGSRQTGSGDADIQDYNVKTGVTIFGMTGVYAGPPATPTGLTATTASATQINLNWNNVGVTGYLLIAREGSAVSFTPVNGTSYSTGAQGSDTIIYVNTGTSYNHSGLTIGSTYHYALYSYEGGNSYSSVVTTSQAATYLCGGAGDSCYDDAAAKAAGVAVTPLGKSLEYVFANGSSGFQVWKEVGSTRILRATGLDEWSKRLNESGRGQSATDFTDAALGTASTLIKGRVCPTHVFVDTGNMTSANNCLYYSPAYAQQRLDAASGTGITNQTTSGYFGLAFWNVAGSGNGTSASWYEGNINTCASKGMRLPTLYETAVSAPSNYKPGDATPTFNAPNGIPSAASWTWTASSYTNNTNYYWIWSGPSTLGNNYDNSCYVICAIL